MSSCTYVCVSVQMCTCQCVFVYKCVLCTCVHVFFICIFLFQRCGTSRLVVILFSLAGQHGDKAGGVDHSLVINVHIVEGFGYFLRGELLTVSGECVLQSWKMIVFICISLRIPRIFVEIYSAALIAIHFRAYNSFLFASKDILLSQQCWIDFQKTAITIFLVNNIRPLIFHLCVRNYVPEIAKWVFSYLKVQEW